MQPNSISGTEEQRQQPGHARKQELLLRSRSKVRKLKRRQKKKKKNYGLLLRINKHAPITPPASFLYKRKKEISHFTKRSLKCLQKESYSRQGDNTTPDLSFINNTTTINFADSSQNNCFWRLSSPLVYKQGKQVLRIKQHCACAILQAAPPIGREVGDVDCAQNITCSHRVGQYQLFNRISRSSFRFPSRAYLITDRNTFLHLVRCNDSKEINRAHYVANAKKKEKKIEIFPRFFSSFLPTVVSTAHL